MEVKVQVSMSMERKKQLLARYVKTGVRIQDQIRNAIYEMLDKEEK